MTSQDFFLIPTFILLLVNVEFTITFNIFPITKDNDKKKIFSISRGNKPSN